MDESGTLAVTAAGTREQLDPFPPLGSFQGPVMFVLQPDPDNTGAVYISRTSFGGDEPTTNDFTLTTSMPIEMENLNQIWVDVETSGESIQWIKVVG